MSMHPGEPSFHQSVARQAETGRACPYCRFPLKEGVQIAVCGICGASHHADCWHDNGGCAVIACVGGPPAGQTREAHVAPTAAYQAVPTQPAAPPAPPTWPQPPPSSRRQGVSLTVAVIILAVAIGGAAVAIVLSRQGSNVRLAANATTRQTVTVPATTKAMSAGTSTGATSTPEDTNTAAAQTNATQTNTDTTQTSTTTAQTNAAAAQSDGILPGVSTQAMQAEIQHMLLEWHEDVVDGKYHAAWELLSSRKQMQDSNEYGYAAWVKNQSTLRPYLDPSGLQVSVENTEPSTGVAQVDVTGMGWDKPGAPCTEWSGITWVKYEDGAWKYDPGYSTTPQREREWKSRFSELLGGRC